MSWQDLVFSVGGLVFIFTLIPMIREKTKIPFKTGAINAFVLWVYAMTFLTMGLEWSAWVAILTAFMWFKITTQNL